MKTVLMFVVCSGRLSPSNVPTPEGLHAATGRASVDVIKLFVATVLVAGNFWA